MVFLFGVQPFFQDSPQLNVDFFFEGCHSHGGYPQSQRDGSSIVQLDDLFKGKSWNIREKWMMWVYHGVPHYFGTPPFDIRSIISIFKYNLSIGCRHLIRSVDQIVLQMQIKCVDVQRFNTDHSKIADDHDDSCQHGL